MRTEDARFMWIFVFFDLPVGTPEERKTATNFRKFLLDDGYMMVQFSVYARICRGQEGVDKHLGRLDKCLPGKGSIRALQVTDKQYERMRLLVGKVSKTEEKAVKQLVLL